MPNMTDHPNHHRGSLGSTFASNIHNLVKYTLGDVCPAIAELTLTLGDLKRYPNNVISNAKYNPITFIPVVLFEEVHAKPAKPALLTLVQILLQPLLSACRPLPSHPTPPNRLSIHLHRPSRLCPRHNHGPRGPRRHCPSSPRRRSQF